MSGLVGSLTGASNAFNELGIKDTVKGIKTAGRVYGRIREAELAKKEEDLARKEEETVDPTLLAQEIKDEIER